MARVARAPALRGRRRAELEEASGQARVLNPPSQEGVGGLVGGAGAGTVPGGVAWPETSPWGRGGRAGEDQS